MVFHGRQAHGATPEKGVNAIWAAHAFLTGVRKLFGRTHGYCKRPKHPWFSPTSINVATINAGSAYNIIPGQCTVGLDVRHVPGHAAEEILETFTGLAQQVRDAGMCERFEITIASRMAPFLIAQDNPLVAAVAAAVKRLHRRTPKCFGMSGTTVCKQLLARNIPAVGFSQDSQNQAHMANEHLRLSEIGVFGKALGLAFLKLGGNW